MIVITMVDTNTGTVEHTTIEFNVEQTNEGNRKALESIVAFESKVLVRKLRESLHEWLRNLHS